MPFKTLLGALLVGVLCTLPTETALARKIDLTIIGTNVEFDDMGLPAVLEGLVYFRGGRRDGELAATYRETLTPIIDPELGFVGTTGESVFLFANESLGQIVTANESFIVDSDPTTGELTVNSVGRIIDGTERFSDVVGGLSSSSTVLFGAEFSLEVSLTLVIKSSRRKHIPEGRWREAASRSWRDRHRTRH